MPAGIVFLGRDQPRFAQQIRYDPGSRRMSDKLRDGLQAAGVVVKDGKEGTEWEVA